MTKIFKCTKGGYPAMITLEEGDIALLALLRTKREGEVKWTITSASAAGDTIHIYRKDGSVEVKRADLFG